MYIHMVGAAKVPKIVAAMTTKKVSLLSNNMVSEDWLVMNVRTLG